jgi:hypothetical protein
VHRKTICPWRNFARNSQSEPECSRSIETLLSSFELVTYLRGSSCDELESAGNSVAPKLAELHLSAMTPDSTQAIVREELSFVAGISAPMRTCESVVLESAPRKIAVLRVGESGIGKDCFSRWLRRLSQRSEDIQTTPISSRGVPRVVNLACGHSRINANVERLRSIPAPVEGVARESQSDEVSPITLVGSAPRAQLSMDAQSSLQDLDGSPEPNVLPLPSREGNS